MSGYFPDSYDVYHFRDNLFNKVDLVSDDFRRWKPLHPEVPQRTGKVYNIEKFDAGFFGKSFFRLINSKLFFFNYLGVTNMQSYNMEPVLRMLFEKTFEAIQDAGYHPSDFENTETGVFAGSCFSETQKFSFYETLIPFSDAIIGCDINRTIRRKIIHNFLF